MKKDAEQLTQKINEIRELQFNKGHQIPLSSQAKHMTKIDSGLASPLNDSSMS